MHVLGQAFCVLIFVLPISIPVFVSFAARMYPVLKMNVIIYSIDSLASVRTSRVWLMLYCVVSSQASVESTCHPLIWSWMQKLNM